MSAQANPYEAPGVDVGQGYDASTTHGDAVAIRAEYLSHEASVQSIGYLYYFSATAFAAVAIMGVATLGDPEGAGLALTAVGIPFCALFAWMGTCLRRLDSRVKLAVGISAGIGLLNLPIGTLINGYILYLVFGEKGKMVFSEEYAAVREQTPDMKYGTSMVVKVFLVVVLVAIVGGIVASMTS